MPCTFRLNYPFRSQWSKVNFQTKQNTFIGRLHSWRANPSEALWSDEYVFVSSENPSAELATKLKLKTQFTCPSRVCDMLTCCCLFVPRPQRRRQANLKRTSWEGKIFFYVLSTPGLRKQLWETQRTLHVQATVDPPLPIVRQIDITYEPMWRAACLHDVTTFT